MCGKTGVKKGRGKHDRNDHLLGVKEKIHNDKGGIHTVSLFSITSGILSILIQNPPDFFGQLVYTEWFLDKGITTSVQHFTGFTVYTVAG